MNKKKQPRTLFYDIETNLHLVYNFSLGKTVLRHGQLLKGYFFTPRIICITYKWAHEKNARIITWGASEKEEREMVNKFVDLLKSADVVIGKNNTRFDNKHINTATLIHQITGDSSLFSVSDDLETHIRKTYYSPSYSLDYFSEVLGLGGKNPMSFSDWVDICNYRIVQLHPDIADKTIRILFGASKASIKKLGKAASKKMFTYGKKDVLDTEAIWNYCKKHFEPKFKHNIWIEEYHGCKRCGGTNLKKRGKRQSGMSIYQEFHCNDCATYAGRAPILKSGKYGKIR